MLTNDQIPKVKMKKNYVGIYAEISKHVYDKLRIHAIKKNMRFRESIEQAIIHYLKSKDF
jgi:hypothetical protein